MTSPTKAPITTHILDQTTGRPAAGVRVHLHSSSSHTDQSSVHVAAHTDKDGRIGKWTEVLSSGTTTEQTGTGDGDSIIAQRIAAQSEAQQWRLVFETGAYFVGKTFWPLVELVVLIDAKDERGHWHVPLLLGPFGYTTYRGS